MLLEVVADTIGSTLRHVMLLVIRCHRFGPRHHHALHHTGVGWDAPLIDMPVDVKLKAIMALLIRVLSIQYHRFRDLFIADMLIIARQAMSNADPVGSHRKHENHLNCDH